MISAKFLWGNALLGGKLQIGAKNSNFEIFESALYMKSGSMPLNLAEAEHLQCRNKVIQENQSMAQADKYIYSADRGIMSIQFSGN